MSGEIAYLKPGGQAVRGSEAVADRLRDLDSAGAVVADAQGRVGLAPNPLAPPEGQRVLCYYPALPPERLGAPAFRRDFGARFAVVAPSSDLTLAQAFGDFGALAVFTPPHRPQEAEMALARVQRAFGGRLFALRARHEPGHPDRAEATIELWARRGGRALEIDGFAAPTLALTLWRAETLSRDAEGAPTALRRLIARVSEPAAAEAFLRPAPAEQLDDLLDRGLIDEERRELALSLPMADAVTASGGETGAWATLPLLARCLRLREALCGPQAWPQVGAAGGASSPQALAALFSMGADHISLDEAAAVTERAQRLGGSSSAAATAAADEFRSWCAEMGLDPAGPPQETLRHLLRAAALESRLAWLALSGAPLPNLHPPRPPYRLPL